ncbi:hypothetical protein WFJ45_22615, partial [Salmonella enterica subsp. enterica serovar Minnesota]|uniref:hypothetical protein n=1 Tax=Salmonella enterica TaxID=28901 RepID=UPI003D29CE6E
MQAATPPRLPNARSTIYRLPSPVPIACRRWDAPAVAVVLVVTWIFQSVGAGIRAEHLLRLPVSLADVVLLLGFLW